MVAFLSDIGISSTNRVYESRTVSMPLCPFSSSSRPNSRSMAMHANGSELAMFLIFIFAGPYLSSHTKHGSHRLMNAFTSFERVFQFRPNLSNRRIVSLIPKWPTSWLCTELMMSSVDGMEGNWLDFAFIFLFPLNILVIFNFAVFGCLDSPSARPLSEPLTCRTTKLNS